MSATAGYTSDVNLNNINYVGDFPAENNLGGVGNTTGAADDYELVLTPPITQGYRPGLLLDVKFNHLNVGVSTLNVDGKGAVPIQKITGSGTLVEVEPNDLNTTVHYVLIYDGASFQVVSGIALDPSIATEAEVGISKFSTAVESNDPANNNTAITPQKMIAYVSDKVTGLWDNKGFIDCSTNPNYPVAESGDVYTVSVAGKIGGALGIEVQANDVIHCLADNAGGTQGSVGESWNVMQANLMEATESLAGIIKIATQAIVDIGTDDQKAITPLKLKTRLDSFINRESVLTITAAHLGTVIYHIAGSNRYSVMNGNMVLVNDIRLKATAGPSTINGWVLNFPIPLNNPTDSSSGTLISIKAEVFYYSMDSNGKVSISGTFIDPNDELLFNIKPYVAQFPIVYNGESPP